MSIQEKWLLLLVLGIQNRTLHTGDNLLCLSLNLSINRNSIRGYLNSFSSKKSIKTVLNFKCTSVNLLYDNPEFATAAATYYTRQHMRCRHTRQLRPMASLDNICGQSSYLCTCNWDFFRFSKGCSVIMTHPQCCLQL